MKREKIRLLSFAMILVLAIIVITPLIVTAYVWQCKDFGPRCNNPWDDGCDAYRHQNCYIWCAGGGGEIIDCYIEPI